MYNVAVATYAAAAINFVVALDSPLLASRVPTHPGAASAEIRADAESLLESNARRERFSWTIYAGIALSGATGLGAEVIWTRLIGILLLATVYALAIVLAAFLFGLALGRPAARGCCTDCVVRSSLSAGSNYV